jgi:hypothetical protein
MIANNRRSAAESALITLNRKSVEQRSLLDVDAARDAPIFG